MEESLENKKENEENKDNKDNEDIEQDYVYLDYFTNGTYPQSREYKEFLYKQSIILKTLKNEVFFSQHTIDHDSLMEQFSTDYHRTSIYIGSPESIVSSPDKLFEYIGANPFLKVNKDNILLSCGQTIMLFPLYLLFKVIGYIVIGERENKIGIQVHVTPTKLLVIKHLRAVNPSNISETLQTFEIFLDVDFAYDETTITIAIE